MSKLSIYDKAQLLKAGQPVFIKDNWFKAKQLEGVDSMEVCSICELDSCCSSEVCEVCVEMETSRSHNWILELCSKDEYV